MNHTPRTRRDVLAAAALGAAATVARAACPAAETSGGRPYVAINQWAVGAMRGRDTKRRGMSLDEELAELAACGVDGLEAGVSSAEQVDALAAQLAKRGLTMRSIYTGSDLIEPGAADRELARFVAVARCAKAAGATLVVTNPTPLPNRRAKTDVQLRRQAEGLNRIGRALAELGVALAYHNHDVELDHAAREFHHMMLGAEPECLRLCLDAHWVYRGAGHSQVALFDVVKLYGRRVVELHLRQSRGNVWSEAFGDGDIDYRALAKSLANLGVKPLLVLEQGPETGTPQTLEVAEAHRRSVAYAREVLGGIAQ